MANTKSNKKFNNKEESSKNYSAGGNKKSRRKSNSSYSKTKSDPDIMRDSEKFYGGNDVSWYTRNADLTESAAKFPFAYQPGRTIDFGHLYASDAAWNTAIYDQTTSQELAINYRYPGFMVMSFLPAVGYSDDIASPINVAARETYARVRSKYSGSLEADAPDIMMYVLAIDSLYMMLEDFKRAYYLINSVTPYNNMFPKLIVKALGYDYDDLLANRTKLYQYILELGSLLKKFMVPANMDLFKRHQFMCANIYADSPTSKSQQYVFKLAGVYKLVHAETMTALSISKRPAQYCTVAQMYNWFKTCLDAVMNWDTAYTITGYLERAFEGDVFLSPAPLVEGAVLSPVYNPEILLQIHNAVVSEVDGLEVTQDPNNNNKLISRPYLVSRRSETSDTIMCNALPAKVAVSIPSSQQPDPASIIIATRLATTPKIGYTDGDNHYVSCGTEVLVEVEFWNGMSENPQTVPTATAFAMWSSDGKSIKFPISYVEYLAYLSAFAYHPHVYITTTNGTSSLVDGEFARSFIHAEVDNLTAVEAQDVDNLHRVCIYSEFNAFR